MTWHQARDFCRSKGGSLASVNNGNEYLRMRQVAMETSADDIWIDGTDSGTENKWLCQPMASRVAAECKILPWAIGQPKHNKDQHCAEIKENREYTVSDTKCSDNSPVMCMFGRRAKTNGK